MNAVLKTDTNFYVIASAAKQSIVLQAEGWIASLRSQ
jgi:hypothetical protein